MLRDLVPGRFDRMTGMVPAWGDRDPIMGLHRDVDRLFDEFRRSLGAPVTQDERGLNSLLAPRIDVVEGDQEVRVEAELPGLSEKDIDVSYADGVLTIQGEKTADTEDDSGRWYLRERVHGRFHREIPLGLKVEEDKIDATFKNGILTVTLPKTAESRTEAKRIPVHG